jgi:Mycothiol maleylpyruvate isomerase N-terminal domain
VYAPSFFLASRRTDAYPRAGGDLTMGEDATPEHLVESLRIATRLLIAVVRDTPDDVRAVIFRRPPTLGAPADFLPRGAMELALHAHDVSVGLAVPFEPAPPIARRLRDHTRRWPLWTTEWNGLGDTDDAWGDLLAASGRERTA